MTSSYRHAFRIASTLIIALSFFFFVLGCGSSRTSTSSSGNNGGGSGSSGATGGSGSSGTTGGSGSSGTSGGSGGSGSSGGSGGSGSIGQAQPARFLYATESVINAVTGFTINSDGSLTPLAQGNVAAGTSPVRAASDPQGKFLYVANQQSQNISAYTIAADGSLSPIAGSPFPVTGPANDVTVDPGGKFVFVADGAQKAAATQAVSVFSIGTNGALTAVPGSPFATQNSPTALLNDPSGKYLYVASGPVEAFSVNQTNGALTPVAGSPFVVVGPSSCPTCSGRTVAFNLAIDPAGKHLYTADGWAGSVYAFDIDATTGTLTAIPGAPFVDRMPTGQAMDPAFNPYGLAVGAKGKFLYGYDSGDEDISYFAVDPSTGALGPVQKTVNTFGGVCAGQILRTDPTGKFLYGLGSSAGRCNGQPAVLVFGIDQTNGSLSVISSGQSTSTTVIQAVPFQDGIAIVP